MPDHKFQVGETVFLESSRNRNIPGGEYVITKKLPERNGGFEYRVKSSKEPHQRIVREDQLKAPEAQTELKRLIFASRLPPGNLDL
jgi:uncharacterized protein YjbK